jgi:hypothetical protein
MIYSKFTFPDGPRQVESEPKELAAKIGETITLHCDIKCEPKALFSWFKNGYETFSNVEIRGYTSSLKVKVESELDFTKYTCLAANDHGSANKTFVLRERTPEEEGQLSKASFTVGATLFTTAALITSTFLL